MNVIEARRTRHLIIRLDRGEELPAALLRALDEAEARAGWIEGVGSLEAAEIALFDQASRAYAKTRRLDGSCHVVGLSGNVARLDGETSVRLSVTLARESDVGLQLSAGELVWARVHALEVHVTAFDDIVLSRVADDRTGLPQIVAHPASAAPALLEPARPTAPTVPSTVAAAPVAAPLPAAPAAPPAPATPAAPAAPNAWTAPTAPAAAWTTNPAASEPTPTAAIPQRPTRPREEESQHYPEAGDNVTHFAFGECVVISSDGERIRLRQDRDGRVREVSLTMLKIENPTVDASTGKRHFHLSRKN